MTVDPDRIATAQTLLAQLGVTVADLQRAKRPAVPTVAEYVPRVLTAAGRAREIIQLPAGALDTQGTSADQDEVRRDFGRCAVQRDGNVGEKSAGAMDDDFGRCAGVGGDTDWNFGEDCGIGEAGREIDLRGMHAGATGNA